MEDMIMNGQVHGSVGELLLQNNFDSGVLRPWISEKDGKAYVTNKQGQNILCNSATLRKDEWKYLDTELVESAKAVLNGVNDLFTLGLTLNLDGMSNTIIQSQTVSDFGEAQMSIDGETVDQNSRVEYGLVNTPLPITHKGFNLNLRVLNMSRKTGTPLDTTQVAMCGTVIGEKIETTYFMGSDFKYGGGQVYGLTTHPDRSTYTLTGDWLTLTGEQILQDVQNMIAMNIENGFNSAFYLYIPTKWNGKLDADFKANSDLTIRERLMKLDNIGAIKISDKLTGSNVTLVNMEKRTVRVVNGLALQNLEWDSKGGMLKQYKSLAIQVPEVRADFRGKCGVVHGKVNS